MVVNTVTDVVMTDGSLRDVVVILLIGILSFCFLAFYQERALLLGQVGRHDEALAIYIHTLHNYKLAEE